MVESGVRFGHYDGQKTTTAQAESQKKTGIDGLKKCGQSYLTTDSAFAPNLQSRQELGTCRLESV